MILLNKDNNCYNIRYIIGGGEMPRGGKNPKYELIISLAKNAKMQPKDLVRIKTTDISETTIGDYEFSKEEETLLIEYANMDGLKIKATGYLFPGRRSAENTPKNLVIGVRKYLKVHYGTTVAELGWRSSQGSIDAKVLSMSDLIKLFHPEPFSPELKK